MGVNPLKQQFEPTDKNPIRQHVQMAGDPSEGGYISTAIGKLFGSSKPKPPAKPEGGEAAPAKEDTTSRRKAIDKAIDG